MLLIFGGLSYTIAREDLQPLMTKKIKTIRNNYVQLLIKNTYEVLVAKSDRSVYVIKCGIYSPWSIMITHGFV